MRDCFSVTAVCSHTVRYSYARNNTRLGLQHTNYSYPTQHSICNFRKPHAIRKLHDVSQCSTVVRAVGLIPVNGSQRFSATWRSDTLEPIELKFWMIFTALHGMQTRSSDEISVCPSVCPSVRPSVCLSNACIVTKRKKNLSRFLHDAKDHSV